MSQIFHKSCYTSRSSGYKYRSLSTNTGDKRRRDSREESTFDRKFKELQLEIGRRIDKQVTQAQESRDSIREKFEKIDAKIDSMLELQNTVSGLKNNLIKAENAIADMALKIERINAATIFGSEAGTMSKRSSFRAPPVLEDEEVLSSTLVYKFL